MAEKQNHVTIFSNGIADFQRVFQTTGEEQQVELHINKEHVGDILASLLIDGPVKLTVPPNFTPENEQHGKLTLSQDNVFQDIFRKLRGAQIKITASGGVIEGRIFGLDSEDAAIIDAKTNAVSRKYYGQILTSTGLRRVLQSEIKSMEFPQESVASEVDKALNRAFQSIRPQSTTVNMQVTSDSPGQEFTLQYTIPAAAWKMTYRLRDTGSCILLDGVGVVDNNTEEDWNDFYISMVVGEPVTFSTDVATSKIPQRQQVNLVSHMAQGGVEVERGIRRLQRARLGAAPQSRAQHLPVAFAASDTCMEGVEEVSAASAFMEEEDALPGAIRVEVQNAMIADTSSREVGDFAVWDIENPLTIKAGQSAEIPVFNTKLKDADMVLFYKFENNHERAFRSVRFKNETGKNLGRGVCTVYEKGVYAGSAILNSAQKDEDILICHAVETGVRVKFSHGSQEHELASLHISKGVVLQTTNWQRKSKYNINNVKDEAFTLVVDHQKVWDENGKLTCLLDEESIEPKEELNNGVRFEVTVPANSNIVLSLTETFTQKQRLNLNKSWLTRTIIAAEHPLLKSASIQSIITLQESYDQLFDVQADLKTKLQMIQSEQERVRGLIESDPDNEQWKDDLRSTEAEIRKINREGLPKIKKDMKDADVAIEAALKEIAAEWTR